MAGNTQPVNPLVIPPDTRDVGEYIRLINQWFVMNQDRIRLMDEAIQQLQTDLAELRTYVDQEINNVYSRLSFKTFMFGWTPDGGINADSRYNIFSLTDEGLGVYRITIDQSTIFGEDLLAQTEVSALVNPTNKIDEGFVVLNTADSGVDTNSRTWFEVALTEAYIQGTSLRARPYVLTGTESLTGFGLANIEISGADPLPP